MAAEGKGGYNPVGAGLAIGVGVGLALGSATGSVGT